jgi:hypothetical protein
MLTTEQRKALFLKISELSGDNEDIMNSLAELQQDDTERDSNSNTFTEADVQDSDGVRWKEKYTQMKTKYRERFFGGSTVEEREPEVKPDASESITIDDLFKKEDK